MLPVLFHIAIPAGWTWVVALGIAAAIVGKSSGIKYPGIC